MVTVVSAAGAVGLLAGVLGSGAAGAGTNPASALRSYVARYGAQASVSPIVITNGGATVAAVATPARDMGKVNPSVVVLHLTGSSWKPVATFRRASFDTPLGRYTPILVGQLTGAASTDFFVQLAGADHTQGVVASNVGGHWHLVSFRKGRTASVTGTNADIVGSSISTSINNCVPDCAAGKYTYVNYTYSPEAGAFIAQG